MSTGSQCDCSLLPKTPIPCSQIKVPVLDFKSLLLPAQPRSLPYTIYLFCYQTSSPFFLNRVTEDFSPYLITPTWGRTELVTFNLSPSKCIKTQLQLRGERQKGLTVSTVTSFIPSSKWLLVNQTTKAFLQSCVSEILSV